MSRVFFILFLVVPFTLVAQNDTLWLKNTNVLYGEIKGLSSGILTMETPYSDDDFTIEYSEVQRFYIQQRCIIILAGGRRLNGFLRSQEDNKVTIWSTEGTFDNLNLRQVTSFQIIEKKVWDRFYGNIDIGFNLTKANNQRQLNIGGGLHYRGFKWFSDFDISSLVANQDNTEEVQRTNINLGLTRMISDKWFVRGTGSFLSNTEQNLEGRYSARVGAGRLLANTSKLVFGVLAGLNYNIETYQDPSLDKESTELYLSTNLNMFDFEDFSLNTRLDVYPSLSEGGRLRLDYILNTKYDLPYDFYIKGEFQFNYDNQVAAGGSEFDYILSTGLGWSFD
jgi:hypothetical protein